jgi:hypothetical protein
MTPEYYEGFESEYDDGQKPKIAVKTRDDTENWFRGRPLKGLGVKPVSESIEDQASRLPFGCDMVIGGFLWGGKLEYDLSTKSVTVDKS